MKKLLLIALLIVGCDKETPVTPEPEDCAGVTGGTAELDNCGVCNGDNSSCVTDIDGNAYEIVQIGEQLWMAENLKVTHYNNGYAIPYPSNDDWGSQMEGQYGVYDDAPSNSNVYGNLYNWYAVNDSRGLCMEGWHVATDDDWKEMELYLGLCDGYIDSYDYNTDDNSCVDNIGWRGIEVGAKLKEAGYEQWDLFNSDATNESGFTALPGGMCEDDQNTNDVYIYVGEAGYFWTATKNWSSFAYDRTLHSPRSKIHRGYASKNRGYSVRCVED